MVAGEEVAVGPSTTTAGTGTAGTEATITTAIIMNMSAIVEMTEGNGANVLVPQALALVHHSNQTHPHLDQLLD